jgi:DNA-directed RNA polymerase subunit N
MMPPIRCFTCGRLIGDKFEELHAKLLSGKSMGAALDELGIKSYCCRRMLMSHYDVSDEIIQY